MIGCGYLGAVHATCMAALGHEVMGVDVSPSLVARLSQAVPPFYDPRLAELPIGRLRFMAAVAGSSVHFLCVGTPQLRGENAAHLSFVNTAFERLLAVIGRGEVVAGKSTVPVGTAERLSQRLHEVQREAVVA